MVKVKDLDKSIEKVKLYMKDGIEMVPTSLYGIYSPTHKEILTECKERFVPTTNENFIEVMTRFGKENKLELLEFFSMSKGGKIVAKFNLGTSKISKINKINSNVLYVVESNDLTNSLEMFVEATLNNESRFLLKEDTMICSLRSTTDFNTRSGELLKMLGASYHALNNFYIKLDYYYDDKLVHVEYILRQLFDKNSSNTTKTQSIIESILNDVSYNTTRLDYSRLNLIYSIGQYFYNNEERNTKEGYFYTSQRKRTKEVLNYFNL